MQREHRWDNLKGVLILLVVIGHFIEQFLDNSDVYKGLWLFVYSFHMPAFFLIAGFFHRNENIGRKIYYYVLLGLISAISVFSAAKLSGSNSTLHFIEVAGLPWFMFSMAGCIALTYLIREIDPYFTLGVAFLIGLFSGYDKQIGDLLALSRTLVYFPFYLLGGCLRLNMDALETVKVKPVLKAGAAILILGWLALCCLGLDRLYLLRPFFTGRNPFSATDVNAPGALVRLICYLITLLIIMAFVVLAPKKRLALLSRMGKNTLQIYLLHMIVWKALMERMQIESFLNDAGAGKLNKLLFLAVAAAIAALLSADFFSAPFDYLKKKCLVERPEQRPLLYTERMAQNGAFSLRKSERIPALAVTVFFVFTFLFYGPLGLYLQNAEELWFSLKNTLTIVVPVSLAAFAGILFLAWMLPRRASRFLICLIFGVTLGLYLQGTLLNISYGGVLDGTSINWGDYTLYGLSTLLVWLICVFGPFVLARWKKIPLRKIIAATALFLTVIQIPALVVERITYTPGAQKNLLVSKNGEFTFARQDNVVILAMDTMDETYFQTYIEAHPEFAEELTGFVHYDNAMASGARTILGMPSMLTGIPYRRASTYTDYISELWAGENTLSAMHEAGYDVRVYTVSSFFTPDTLEYVDNFVNSAEKVGSYSKLAEKLYQLTAYKFAPHYLKQRFWMDTAEFVQAQDNSNRFVTNDELFYQDYRKAGLLLSDDYDRAFRYYLINGAHAPFHLTENAEYVSEITSRERQVEGVFKIVKEILSEMKEKGIYDSATIVLTTDHGDRHKEEHVTFLYKAPNARQPYSTSHAPVSLFDLPVLLYEIIGREMPNNEYGVDFRNLSEASERERHFFRNTSGNSKIMIEEYITDSAIQDHDALKLVTSYEDARGPETPYTFGVPLSFDMNATGNIYSVEGFGQNTGYRTLLVGPKAVLRMKLAEVPQDGFLDIHIGVSSSIDNVKETIIQVNGKQAFHDTVDRKYVSPGIVLRLPVEELELGDEGWLEISFLFPDIPEEEMEISTPKRTRSFSLTSLLITHAEQ